MALLALGRRARVRRLNEQAVIQPEVELARGPVASIWTGPHPVLCIRGRAFDGLQPWLITWFGTGALFVSSTQRTEPAQHLVARVSEPRQNAWRRREAECEDALN